MAQGIRPLNYARESLPASSAGQGLMAMNPPGIGRTNPDDGGDPSKVNMNPQFAINQGLQMQNMQQNGMTSAFQQQAGMKGAAVSQITEANTATQRAQEGLQSTVAQIMLSAPNGAPGMSKFQNIMGNTAGRARLLNDVSISQQMYQDFLSA